MKLKPVLNCLASLVLFVLLTGCATPSRVGATTLRNHIQSEAEKLLGHREYVILWLPSRGATADTTFIAMSKTAGPSKMAKEIGKLLPEAKEKNLAIIIGGVNDSKNIQVLNDAFDLNAGTDLKNLQMVFAGRAKHQQEITERAKRLGINFHFIELKNES